MGYTIKSEGDLSAALTEIDVAMKGYDDRLEKAGGSIAETAAIVKDMQDQLQSALSRSLPSGAPVELMIVEAGKALTWDAIHKHPTAVRKSVSGGFERADKDDLVGQFQDASDQLYILAGAMKLIDSSGHVNVVALRATKFYQHTFAPLRKAVEDRVVGKAAGDAFSHVAGAGGTSGTEWNPAEFSNRLFEKPRIDLKVASLIPTFNMPRSPFLFPVQLADLTAYLSGENNGPGTGSFTIADAKGATIVTGSKTFTAVKMATMAFTSKEIEEDSIVAILPFLEGAVIQAVRNGLEDAILNGDTAGTHMDFDITSAASVKKSFDGLRDYAINVASGGTKDSAGNSINSDAAWRDYVRGARKLMAEAFKGNNAKLALVCSGNTAIDIGSADAFRYAYAFAQTSSNSNPDITGFKPDGLGAFVVSEFVRSNVSATGVNTNGGLNASTTIIQFAPEAWMLGVVRSLRIEVLRERYAEFDQDAVKITWRGDLKPMLSGNHTVATVGIPA